MALTLEPIGFVRTPARTVPRHYRASEVEGVLEIDERYREGLADLQPGERVYVLFHFHESEPFDVSLLRQTPPHRDGPRGVFSTCSPRRPNPIGLSVLEVLGVSGSAVRVRGLDMIDGTPVLDIKPFETFDRRRRRRVG